MPGAAWRIGIIMTGVVGIVSPAPAQERLRLQADVLFYGDNTEFRNPFREGETIFGAAGRVCAAVDLNDRVVLRAGAFARQRFGSDDGFDLVRPVLSLTLRGRASTFVVGTLPSRYVGRKTGDAGTLHGLLPPLQRETLVFERSYEAGLLWTVDRTAVQHSAWVNWQRLNTPEHRERFDTGLVTELRISEHVSVPVQGHLVHQGGQLHDSGPVTDSYAGGAGVALRGDAGRLGTGRIEAYALASRHVPNRETPAASRTGRAVFARASAGAGGWVGHLVFWRGRHFVKEEGDANYLSLRRNGRYYGGTRDYAEAGLTRRWNPAPEVWLEASARMHRTERDYEYSFRIVATSAIEWPR
jgi:hypothetical protein